MPWTAASLYTRSAGILAACARPRVRWGLMGFAMLLVMPALGGGLALDDYMLHLSLREDAGGIEGMQTHPLDLFTFASGDRDRTRALMAQGAGLSWWTFEDLHAAFFRPLASATHLLDEWLWPRTPALMYAHSLAWLALVIALAACVYGRLCTSAWVAGVATVLYAFDDAHAQLVGWISNRNALIATAFALLALWAHDHWRRARHSAWLGLSCLSLTLGLLAGEFAVGICAYLFAYALLMEEGPLRPRLWSLVPYASIVIIWRIIYRELGYGVRGIASYIDPGADPLRFARALPERASLLWGSLLWGPPADLAAFLPPEWAPMFVAVSVVVVGSIIIVVLPALRARREARFWALGSLLSTVPVAATWPSDRLLLLTGIGGMAMLAHMLHHLARQANIAPIGLMTHVVVVLLALSHLVWAPIARPIRAQSAGRIASELEMAYATLPPPNALAGKTLIFVNVPSSFWVSYLQFIRAWRNEPRPDHVYWLAVSSSDLHVVRVGDDTLRVRPEQGFLYSVFEQHFRSPTFSMPTDHQVHMPGLMIRVVSLTPDGRPDEVDFELTEGADADQYSVWQWRHGRFEPFRWPAPGEQLHFESEDFLSALHAARLFYERHARITVSAAAPSQTGTPE